MDTIQSIKLANDMKMHGIAESLERRLAQYTAEPVDISKLIRLPFEDEKISRDNKKASRLVTRAKFRRNCHLEDWVLNWGKILLFQIDIENPSFTVFLLMIFNNISIIKPLLKQCFSMDN